MQDIKAEDAGFLKSLTGVLQGRGLVVFDLLGFYEMVDLEDDHEVVARFCASATDFG
ncbi:MAG: hypothetical protein AAB427_13615 [Chloroflexota bacterium]